MIHKKKNQNRNRIIDINIFFKFVLLELLQESVPMKSRNASEFR